MFVLAHLRKPRGLRGEIWADVLCGDFDQLVEYVEQTQLWLCPHKPQADASPEASGPARPVSVELCRPHKGAALLKFSGIDSCDSAEALRGYFLAIAPHDLPELAEGEYYLFQLQGLQVVDGDGQVLGRVKEALESPGHEQLVVEPSDGGRIFYIPFVSAFISNVDLSSARITASLPEGFREAQY